MTEIDNQLRTESKCEQHRIGDTAEAGVYMKEAACNDDTEISSCAPVELVEVCSSPVLAQESDNMQIDGSADYHTNGVLSNVGLPPCLENNVKDVLDNTGLVLSAETQCKEVENSAEVEDCSVTHVKEVESSTELEHVAERRENVQGNEGCCLEVFAEEAPQGEDAEPKDVTNDPEVEPYAENHEMQVMENVNLELLPSSDVVKEADNGFGLESCPQNKAKEASTDDIYSEVSNPNLSPKHVASTLTASSQAVDVLGIDRGGCGEITSAYSQRLSGDGGHDKEECIQSQKMEIDSKSCVVLEIPKHISTTGIRKITFKFSKRKEKFDSESVAVKPIAYNDGNEAYYNNPISISGAYPSTVQSDEWKPFENTDWNLGINGSEFHDTQSSFSSFSNRELKMSKKIMPDNYPTNVKKLLSTRILEGARVKYISTSGEKEIPGIIKDCGYLCGCSFCNFSRVLSAYEFELHAGTKTRHPNNHIYLENGKPIYSIIEELRTAPVSTLDDVIRAVAGSSVNEEYFQVWKENLLGSKGVAYAGGLYQSNHYGMYSSHTSYLIQPSEDNLHLPSSQYPPLIPFNQQSYKGAAVERKHCVKKPRHHSSSSAWKQKKAAEGGPKKRDNDLHKLLFMPNGLPDGTDLAYYSKGKRILGGYKQGNGIVCSCCDTEISPSQFEAHAGWAAKRQPYRNIYISSGLALHDIALMLVNGQNRITCGNDDMCAVCGDGGELVICNGCPRAYHAACLGLWNLPADGWHCPHCNDKFGPGKKVSGESKPIDIRLTRVVKAPELEPGGCVLCRSQDFSAAKFDDRTVILCDQCEKEYHVGCLRESGFCDLKELPKDKWFCCDDCNKIFVALQKLASGGPELIPTSVLSAMYKKHAAVGLNDGSNNEITWQILSGKSRFPKHLLLLSQAAAIFRECFDPINAASGRDLIPVMVYGRNISGQEFSGMYCVVFMLKSIVVSAALLRIFGQEVAELPLAATGRENQGKGYFQALFSCIERLLLSMNVKHLVLPAAEEAEHMWTKKLGFRKTNNEQMMRYTRDLQLTMFKGTALLEKDLQQVAE